MSYRVEIPKTVYRYEECELEGDYVATSKQWLCKSCKLLLCDQCFQNRKRHECILDQEE